MRERRERVKFLKINSPEVAFSFASIKGNVFHGWCFVLRDAKVLGFDPWVGKILWKRKWQPPPVLLPGKSHEWRSLVGYSPWGRKESDMTE